MTASDYRRPALSVRPRRGPRVVLLAAAPVSSFTAAGSAGDAS
jgi:hypothetical protein